MNVFLVFSLLFAALASSAFGQYYYGYPNYNYGYYPSYGYGNNYYRNGWNPVRGAARGALLGAAVGQAGRGALVGAALGRK